MIDSPAAVHIVMPTKVGIHDLADASRKVVDGGPPPATTCSDRRRVILFAGWYEARVAVLVGRRRRSGAGARGTTSKIRFKSIDRIRRGQRPSRAFDRAGRGRAPERNHDHARLPQSSKFLTRRKIESHGVPRSRIAFGFVRALKSFPPWPSLVLDLPPC